MFLWDRLSGINKFSQDTIFHESGVPSAASYITEITTQAEHLSSQLIMIGILVIVLALLLITLVLVLKRSRQRQDQGTKWDCTHPKQNNIEGILEEETVKEEKEEVEEDLAEMQSRLQALRS